MDARIVVVVALVALAAAMVVARRRVVERFAEATMEPRVHVWVLSIEASAGEKRGLAAMRANLEQFGVPPAVEFIGVDGRRVNQATLDRFHESMRSRLGVVGCYLSHVLLWEKAAMMPDNDRVLILEDDAVAIRNFETARVLASPWDLLYLGHCFEKLTGEVSEADPGFRRAVAPMCTHAYVISPRGAREALRAHRWAEAIDHELLNMVQSGTLSTAVADPGWFIMNGETASMIDKMAPRY